MPFNVGNVLSCCILIAIAFQTVTSVPYGNSDESPLKRVFWVNKKASSSSGNDMFAVKLQDVENIFDCYSGFCNLEFVDCSKACVLSQDFYCAGKCKQQQKKCAFECISDVGIDLKHVCTELASK
ncbi:uncharacterized protein [Antedon mediterranea]|uniref:uncharacterized protein n=1 Tax=Antedon mediterranea TaxID=105859 RepID=UPI003AF76DB6